MKPKVKLNPKSIMSDTGRIEEPKPKLGDERPTKNLLLPPTPAPPKPPPQRPPQPPQINARVLAEMSWVLERIAVLPMSVADHNRSATAIQGTMKYVEDLERAIWTPDAPEPAPSQPSANNKP